MAGRAARYSVARSWPRLFEGGRVDQSVAEIGEDPEESSDILFNALCWPYVHLRGSHHWSAARARSRLRALISPSLDPAVTGPRRDSRDSQDSRD